MGMWMLRHGSWALIWLTLKAWGRCWIDDVQCRTALTAIMHATIWLVALGAAAAGRAAGE